MISTRVGLQAALNGDRTKAEHLAPDSCLAPSEGIWRPRGTEGGELGCYDRRPTETALAQDLADDPWRCIPNSSSAHTMARG
jgi:hypothetical protein